MQCKTVDVKVKTHKCWWSGSSGSICLMVRGLEFKPQYHQGKKKKEKRKKTSKHNYILFVNACVMQAWNTFGNDQQLGL
jgi:hypothetical protein